MPTVFISHSNQDEAATLVAVDCLKRAGFDVWVDFENIRGGADWLCEIEAGIDRCQAVATILSKASLKSVWVERECLFAFQLRKPVFTLLIDDVRLPLHLINIQYCDGREDLARGVSRLASALKAALADRQGALQYEPGAASSVPMEANFFPYLAQLPGGDIASAVARDLFDWARSAVDEIGFGGKAHPVCHARLELADRLLTLFSIRAYPRKPSLQLPLAQWSSQKPYHTLGARRQVLRYVNRLLPPGSRMGREWANRRPTFPLGDLEAEDKRRAFKGVMAGVIADLRAGS